MGLLASTQAPSTGQPKAGLINRAPTAGLLNRGTGGGAINSLDDFKAHIAAVESSGRYDAVGVQTKSGDRAYGKYQVMGNNLPSWGKEYLGRPVTAQEFLQSPQLQEELATKRFDQLYKQYGNWEDVASVWFTGRPRAQAGGSVADITGTTNDQYISRVVGTPQRSATAVSTPPTMIPAAPAPAPVRPLIATPEPVKKPGLLNLIKDTVLGLPQAAKEVATDIVHGVAAGGQKSLQAYAALPPALHKLGSIPLDIIDPSGKAARDQARQGLTLAPQGQFQQDLYGTSQPITVRSVGSQVGIPEGSSFAAPTGFAIGALDLVPGGNLGKTAAVEALRTVETAKDAVGVLSRILGMSREVAAKYADDAVRLTDPAQLSHLVDVALKESQDVIGSAKRTGSAVKNLFKGEGRQAAQSVARTAEQDWQENYAEEATRLFDQSTQLQNELKSARAGDRAAIQSALDDVNARSQQIEESFIQKWGKNMLTASEAGSVAPTPNAMENIVKSVTKPTEQVSEELDNLRQYIRASEDAIRDMPGRELARFTRGTTGDLPEFIGGGARTFRGKEIKATGKWAKDAERVMENIGYNETGGYDVAKAQELVDQYKRAKQNLDEAKALEREMSAAEKTARQSAKAKAREDAVLNRVLKRDVTPAGRWKGIAEDESLARVAAANEDIRRSDFEDVLSGAPRLAETTGRSSEGRGLLKRAGAGAREPRTRVFSKEGSLPQGVAQARQKAIEATAQATGDTPKEAGRVINKLREAWTKIVEYVSDTDERVRQLVNTKGVRITDESDPYLKMTLYSGRLGKKIEEGYDLSRGLIEDMAKTARSIKVPAEKLRDEVSEYLHVLHAPERNAALGDGASGMTTAEATARLKEIEASPHFQEIKKFADSASKLNGRVLDMLHDSGVIGDDLFTTLREKYQHHVPLNRIMDETQDIGSVLAGGSGYSVRSTGLKRAVGSGREVADIMTNILTNYEQAAIRSEKNLVDLATLRFARDNQDIVGDILKVEKPKVIGMSTEGRPLIQQTQDPNILQMYENGKPVWIRVSDPNLAIALRGVGREKLGSFLNAVASFTRFFAGLATRFNPEFAFPNKIRDLQETMVYLASQKGTGFKGAGKTLVKDPGSIKDIVDSLRGKDTPGARLYNEMRQMGGTTGGFGLSTRHQVEINLEKLQKLANSPTRKVAHNLIEYVDHWNTIFEDSTRLSVYKSALSQGLSKERAAAMAKEASINFNRMGKGGPVINALYMFANAAIRGTVKTMRSLKNPKVLGAVVLTVGTSVAAVNEWNDHVDPEWRDKVSKWDRLNGLTVVIPTPDGEGVKYVTLPVAWGIKPIKVMADYAYDAYALGNFDGKGMAQDTITAIAEAYNPLGGSNLVSAITPTILDTPIEIARNQSWSGSKIKPDSDPNAPADIRYFDSLKETKTGQAAISVSEFLRDKGNIVVSPADLAYGFQQYVGGAGRTIQKTLDTALGAVSGEPVPKDQWPMLSRFYRERTAEEVGQGAGGNVDELKAQLQAQSRDRFYTGDQATKIAEQALKLSQEQGKAAAVQYLNQAVGNDPALKDRVKSEITAQKSDLSYEEGLIKQLGVSNGKRAEYIVSQVNQLSTRDEKIAYLENLSAKGIISKEVKAQIQQLLKK